MKQIFILLSLLLSANVFALTSEFKGFIALNLLKVQKEEKKDTLLETGIGTVDLKFYAQHGDLSSKIKLDLDDKNLDEAYNLFEEAIVTYTINDFIAITAGKGLVPFHQKHYGILESSYIDGGSPLGANNSWRDQDNKLLTILKIGSYSQGLINRFTFYGENKQIIKDSNNKPILDSQDKLQYADSKSFKTSDEKGFSNKLEVFFNNLALYISGIHYSNNVAPRSRYALDVGGRYKTKELEIWAEYMYGLWATHQGHQYAAYKKYEHFIQLGAEFYINDLINWIINSEVVLVDDIDWDTTTKDETNNCKLETGIKFKIRKNSFFTVGILGERKDSWQNKVKQPTRKLAKLGFNLALWF
jgi:hypothetical protein